MDTSRHAIEGLFMQLGLPPNIPLEQAAFWSAGQAEFIHEAVEFDPDWAEVVDLLNAQLRH